MRTTGTSMPLPHRLAASTSSAASPPAWITEPMPLKPTAQAANSISHFISIPLIPANFFNSISVPAPNGGGYVGAIHLQGYGGNSVWVGATTGLISLPETGRVPEPATLALLGLGI